MRSSAAYALANAVVNGCWLIFVILWIVAAFATKKTIYSESLARRAALRLFLIAGLAVLINAPFEPYPLNAFFVPQRAVTASIAAAMCVLGLAFAIWARLTIGANWSGRVTLKENHELIQRGPYSLARHPIYTGVLAMTFGSALLIGRFGALAGWIFLVVAFLIKSRQEEALMLQQFPAQYAAYRQRVKRLVPFIL